MPAAINMTTSGYGAIPLRAPRRRAGNIYRGPGTTGFAGGRGQPTFPTGATSGGLPSAGGNANVSGPMPPPNPMISHQGGLSTNPKLTAPAGASGVLPGFEDGGSMDDTQGFNGIANDDSPDAFDAINSAVQYGRQKSGLTGNWRRSENVEDDRDQQMGSGEKFVRQSLQDVGRGLADTLGYNKLNSGGDTASAVIPRGRTDTGVVAIPGTLQDQAGLNDVGMNYKDGGAVEEDNDENEAIPTRPAGPGGDRPDDNPFPVKRPNPPFGKRYDDGGSVDDDDDDGDSTGAIPADGDGDDNASPAPEGEEATPAMGGSQNPQKLVSYLLGADAAPPQLVDAIERSIDPEGKLDPDTRHMAAIQQAAKQGGNEAAWQVLQHYRKKYDASKAFAAAALNGVGGKPPDIAAAAQAASKAYTYMPDGTSVSFQPGQNGVTATVKRVGSQQPFGNVTLTPEQFHEFVRGKAGQFDNVLENSGPRVLSELQTAQGRPFDQGAAPMNGPAPTQTQPQRPPQQQFGQGAQSMAAPARPEPSDEERRQAFYDAPRRNANYDKELEARSFDLYPQDRTKRLEWLNAQMQARGEQETARIRAERPWEKDKASATQAGRLKVAETYTQSRERMADANNVTKRDIAFAAQNVNSADRRVAADARLVASANNSTQPIDPDTDQGKATIEAAKRLRRYQYGNTGGAQSQQRAPAQGGQPPAGHPGAKQDPQGKWREKGPDGLWHLIQ